MAANPHTTRRSHRIWPWIALGAAALAVAFVLSSSPVKEALDVAVSWAHGLIEEHPVTGALVFFLMSAISAMFAFASSAVLVPAAGLA
jgi:uncharacterized membrane protein YdjX (TVP38/TMEM64 family)